MTTRQLRAQLNTPKRKHTLPLPIRRRRAQIQCHDWANAEANNQPLPNTPCQVSQFAQNAPRLPNYLNLHRYIVCRRRAKTNPNPYDLIRALLPQTRQSGQHPRIMNLHLPVRQPIQSPQPPPKRCQMAGKINKISPTNPQKAATPKAKDQPNGWKWGEMGGNKKTPAPNPPPTRQRNLPAPQSIIPRTGGNIANIPPIAPPQIQPQSHPRRRPPQRGTAKSPQQNIRLKQRSNTPNPTQTRCSVTFCWVGN